MVRGALKVSFSPGAPLRFAKAPTLKPTARRPREHNAYARTTPTLTLAEPDKSRSQKSPQTREARHLNQQILHTFSNENDEFKTWSKDFIQLCDAQLSLLSSTVHNLAQVTLFFRHENSDTGALEFFPLIAHSSASDDAPARVWISFGAAGQTELEDGPSSRRLPGGIPAKWIFPDYPFTRVGCEGGILMPDGSLCIPIEYNNVLAGSLVLVPEKSSSPPGQLREPWSKQDIRRSDMVGKSIALAAALETKSSAKQAMWETDVSLINSIHTLLRTTLHQVRSPITALVTLGHLLLRRLPVGDVNRETARSMIKEAMRVDDLLKPLDAAQETLALPAGEADENGREEDYVSNDIESFEVKPFADALVSDTPPHGDFDSGRELLWLSDVLRPIADIYAMIAEEREIHFSTCIDEDAPPVLAIEKFVREAVGNILDNSTKYSPPGSHAGVILASDAREDEEEGYIEVTVWDTGFGFTKSDRDIVWNFGYRGSAASKTGVEGSGIGLAVVKELLDACDVHVELVSPLPPTLDPRSRKDAGTSSRTPGSAIVLRFQRPSRG
ncbi:Histidine kinase [Gracilaria domingensis]|nr:Histidine kinase [Gracilaria domingensis]